MMDRSETPGTRMSAAWQLRWSEPRRLARGLWPDVTMGRFPVCAAI